MVLAESTWAEIDVFPRDSMVLIPTGATEQHGVHLPLLTDSLIVQEIARQIERNLTDWVILCPVVWLGASAAHLPFAGTLTASFTSYHASLNAIIRSFQHHGFNRFYILNGHGGNSDSNRMVLKEVKDTHPNGVYVHTTYFELIQPEIEHLLKGPSKRMTHGCEAETSLLLHLRPDLVRMSKARKDGMKSSPSVTGLIQRFDELSETGSIGYPQFATAETGARLFQAAVDSVTDQLERLRQTLVMVEI
jgi:creatinine amidohydrolase